LHIFHKGYHRNSTMAEELRFFISYSPHAPDDLALAKFLATELRSRGHDAFMDNQLPLGVRWADEIENKLKDCNRFAVLLSATSITRDMVIEEVRRGYERAKSGSLLMLPIRVRYQEKFPFELAAYLGGYQAIFWRGSQDNEVVVDRLLGSAPATAIPARAPARWPSDNPVEMLRGIDGARVAPALVPVKLVKAVAEACADRSEAAMVVQQAEEWLLEAGEISPGVMLSLEPQFLPDVRDNPLNYWLQTFSRASTRGARVLVALLAALPPSVLASQAHLIARALNAAQAGLGELISERS
jgi:hypothetical protein